ncbi:MAG: hypothetical protein AAFR61_05495 [Bacteroidota bacterium]
MKTLLKTHKRLHGGICWLLALGWLVVAACGSNQGDMEQAEAPPAPQKIIVFVDGEFLIRESRQARKFIRKFVWEHKALNSLKFGEQKKGAVLPALEVDIFPICDLTNQSPALLSFSCEEKERSLMRTYRDASTRIIDTQMRLFNKNIKKYKNAFLPGYRDGGGPRPRLTKVMESADLLANLLSGCQAAQEVHILFLSDMIEWDHSDYSFKKPGIDEVNSSDIHRARHDLADPASDLFQDMERRKKLLNRVMSTHFTRAIEVISPKLIVLNESGGMGRPEIEAFWHTYFEALGFKLRFRS